MEVVSLWFKIALCSWQQEPVKTCFVYRRERTLPIQRPLRKNHRFVLGLGHPMICFCTSSVGRSALLKLLPFSEANPVLTVYSSSSALRSMMFHAKLQRFFLAAPEKAVVRLSEAEDPGGPVSTVEAFCTLNGTCKWYVT